MFSIIEIMRVLVESVVFMLAFLGRFQKTHFQTTKTCEIFLEKGRHLMNDNELINIKWHNKNSAFQSDPSSCKQQADVHITTLTLHAL